jgi:hypothetical protein
VISTLASDRHVIPGPFPTHVLGTAEAVGAATIATAAAAAASSGVTHVSVIRMMGLLVD